MRLEPIGVIHSEVTERRDMPTLGAAAAIEVFTPYEDGLRHLEKHSHLWVIVWLHQAARDKLVVKPRGVSDESEAGLHGVFAVRSPTRPNPLGLSVARIEAIEGTKIQVDRLDFLDGTPVVDLKPYFRRFEAIAVAKSARIGRPADRDMALKALLIEAENLHGERCPGLALAARIVEHARSTLFDYCDPPVLRLKVPEHRGCLVDCLTGLLGLSFGKGTLQLHAEDVVVMEYGRQREVYELKWPLDGDFATTMAALEARLFHFTRDD